MTENTLEKCIIYKYIQVYIHIYTRAYQNSWVFLRIPRNTLGSAHAHQEVSIHKVSFKNTCHLQQGRTNPEYSIILRKTYPSRGKKRLQGYTRLSGLWFIATAESITKGASLY
jgi:hypothetical protein